MNLGFNGTMASDFTISSQAPSTVTMGNVIPVSTIKVTGPSFNYSKPSVAVKTDDDRLMPKRAHRTDAGADLFSKEKHIIYPNQMQMVDTGVAVRIPENYVGLVFSRSGQGKLRIHLANSVGVIDADYRGPIKVIIVNEGDEPYEIHPYVTKIAQLVVMPIMLCDFHGYAGNEEDWMNTTRGSGGFGSTN